MIEELDLERGWVAGELAAEFPELRLVLARVEAKPMRRSPRPVKERLLLLSDRFTGPKAIAMRREAVALSETGSPGFAE